MMFSITGPARIIMNTVSAGLSAFGIQDDSAATTSEPFTEPTVEDVLTVRDLLQFRGRLPIELIDCIVDYAGYWPHTTTATTSPLTARGQVHGRPDQPENAFTLRSLPLGYSPEALESNLSIPIEAYLNTPAETDVHFFESMDPSWTATDDILNRWTERSQPRSENPCRKIIFTIQSADQGWGALPSQRGTFAGSYSWFDTGKEHIEIIDKDKVDARPFPPPGRHHCELGPTDNGDARYCCILRPLDPAVTDVTVSPTELRQAYAHPFLPPSTRLQSNVTATRIIKEHVITWSYHDDVQPESLEGDELEKAGRGRASGNGEYVRNLKLGDVITVWARARFPGWLNNVEHVRIDVYWAV